MVRIILFIYVASHVFSNIVHDEDKPCVNYKISQHNLQLNLTIGTSVTTISTIGHGVDEDVFCRSTRDSCTSDIDTFPLANISAYYKTLNESLICSKEMTYIDKDLKMNGDKVQMKGVVTSKDEITMFRLFCFSCTKPFGDHVEFFVNQISEDNIRLHNNKCYHKGGECIKDKCSCSENSYIYAWAYRPEIASLSYNFTCAMRFKSRESNKILEFDAHVLFNGTEFVERSQQAGDIVQQKIPDTSDDKATNSIIESPLFWTGIGFMAFMVIIFGLTTTIYILMMRKKNKAFTMETTGEVLDEMLPKASTMETTGEVLDEMLPKAFTMETTGEVLDAMLPKAFTMETNGEVLDAILAKASKKTDTGVAVPEELRLKAVTMETTSEVLDAILAKASKKTDTAAAVPEEMRLKEEAVIKYRTTCVVCENLTSYAFCQTCKEYLCETCSNDHRKKEPEHVIFQLVNLYRKENWLYCNQCNSRKSFNFVRLCKLCKKVLCAVCQRICFHHNQDQYPIMTLSEKTFRRKRSIYSDSDMHLKTHRSFSFQDHSHTEKPVRIRGIAFLFKEGIAIADYNNNCMHIYQNESRYSKIKFDYEPRGMAGIDSNHVVVTFSYAKRICIIYIDSDGQNLSKSIPNVPGKPFCIAYHDKHFVVEFNEGEDGFIGVLDVDGNIISKTENIACFFTGNTIRLALDMKAKRIFVSALGKQEVSCIHFDPQKLEWKVKASSPRSIILIHAKSVSAEPMIMLSSKMSNTLYQLNPNSGRKTNAKCIQKPRYITYQPDGELIAVESEDTIIVFKLEKRHRSD